VAACVRRSDQPHSFLAYFAKFLVPMLLSDDIVAMDNLGSYKGNLSSAIGPSPGSGCHLAIPP
jgi:hypothetical protein